MKQLSREATLNIRSRAGISVIAIAVLAVAAPAAQAATVGPDANGGSAPLVPGESLTVKLRPADSGSTGFHWHVSGKPATRVLRFKSSRATRNGKQQVFTYRALRPGGAVLKLGYRSPGRSPKVVKTFRLSVVVNEREPRLDCNATGRSAGYTVVTRNPAAVAFKIRRSLFATEFGKPVKERYDAYYGCELRRNRAFRLAGVVDLINPHSFDDIVLNGSVVGYHQVVEACPYDTFDGCSQAGSPSVGSQDLHTGKVIRVARVGRSVVGSPSPVPRLVVSSTGGLAWTEDNRDPDGNVENFVLRDDSPVTPGHPSSAEREFLDRGADVDTGSLQFDGTAVTWIRGGTRQQAPLH